MTRLSAIIAAVFPRSEYIPGLGLIAPLPGALAPCPDKLRQQDAGQQQAKGRRGSVVHHGSPTATVSE